MMNLQLTKVLGDVTGVTGLKIIRAILAGERDPQRLAEPRDRRCQHAAPAIAQALDGHYRPEHLLELRCYLAMGEKYQEVMATVDTAIAAQLRSLQRHTELPRPVAVIVGGARGTDGDRQGVIAKARANDPRRRCALRGSHR